ncbi:MAG: hypothetical protein KatS3mg039_0498 [Candidatus Kapaibacterium sp.]|nr:MAG: hypothetical protein KatS3mg039_0498 [Candidatus Kapabacteria bacterium]
MRLFRRPGFWILLVVAAIVGWLIFSRYGILTRIELEHTDSALDHAIEQQRHINDSLVQYRSRLLRDTLLIEQLARERYGMTRPGETVLIVVDSSK